MDAKISQWKRKNEEYMQSIKARIEELKKKEASHIYSYFTYSIQFSHDPANESLLIGSFHIQNNGKDVFQNPYICLKLKENSILHFSGKYVYKDSTKKVRMPGAWEKINEKSEKEEFWLQPIGATHIEPGESLSFNNFQLKWKPHKKYAESLNGFAYGEGFEKGIPSLNQINIGGTNVREEEDEGG
ncbi:hypothetical protein ACJA3J_09290 [Halobacillus sp. SY10]|uniref:hypothetical protein n=1 Tax=Halobacillus sp. SY10 TaxID=3381356 RepID=UPI003879E9CF